VNAATLALPLAEAPTKRAKRSTRVVDPLYSDADEVFSFLPVTDAVDESTISNIASAIDASTPSTTAAATAANSDASEQVPVSGGSRAYDSSGLPRVAREAFVAFNRSSQPQLARAAASTELQSPSRRTLDANNGDDDDDNNNNNNNNDDDDDGGVDVAPLAAAAAPTEDAVLRSSRGVLITNAGVGVSARRRARAGSAGASSLPTPSTLEGFGLTALLAPLPVDASPPAVASTGVRSLAIETSGGSGGGQRRVRAVTAIDSLYAYIDCVVGNVHITRDYM
jgi:hypothetical protein